MNDEKVSIKNIQTITSWLDKVIKSRDKNIALVDEGEKITYFELGKNIDEYSKVFINLGITNRRIVILQIGNVKEYVYTLFALIKIGAIPVIINPILGIYEVERIINEVNPCAYLYLKDNNNLDESILKKIKEEYTNIITLSVTEINNLYKENNSKDIYYDSDIEDVAFLMMSGGTTGSAKLVPITHSMIFFHISSYCRNFGFESSDSYLAILPLSHKMGLYSPGLLNFLFIGGKTVLCKSGSCDEWFSLIESEKITVTSLVPTLANIWIDFLKYDNSYDLSTIRGIYIGGSIISAQIISNLLNSLNCNIQIIYGATEGIAMYSTYNRDSRNIRDTYKNLINGQEVVKIVDENGNEVKENEKGELIVKGPYTINNYYRLENNTTEKFTEDGYYRTGDLCMWSKKYGYKILGRAVDVINRAGEKIDPIEIENIIMTYPGIDEAVSVGVKNDFLGEKHYLFIKSNNKNIKLKNIKMFLKSKGLASYKYPDELRVIDRIPLTHVNKTDRKKLREIAEI